MTSLVAQLLTIAVVSLQRQMYYNRELRLNTTRWWNSTYDFVIVGGGSAGCIVAARLSENSSVSVLLIEAGGPVTIMSDIIPAYYYFNHVWPYHTVPQRYASRGVAGRRVSYPRGRILGGSSTVNYAVYIRGNRRDFDSWTHQYGANGWTFDEVLPYFLRSENNTDPQVVQANPHYHSTSGPVQISTVPNPDPIFSHWQEAARAMGWPIGDLNGPEQYGASVLQTTQSALNWTRQNTYSAYIAPIIGRPNLHVLTNSQVTRILFQPGVTPPTAAGVEFVRNNQTYQVYATREVIISGGTINSAQILMLSGIGPKWHLNQLNIPVLADLPVGESLTDHFIVPLDFMVTNESDIGWTNGRVSAFTADTLYQFFANNDGPLTRIPGLEMYIATGINGNRDWPDGMMYLLINQKYYNIEEAIVNYDQNRREEWTRYLSELIGNDRHIQLAFSVFRPVSSGTIRLASTSPFEYPLIDPNYLSNTQDLAAVVRAMSIGLQIAESDRMRSRMSHYAAPIPGCQFCSDSVPLSRCYQYLTCAATTYTETTSHPVGTCRMGNSTNPRAVVDERLRVRGVRNLRVIDASVMPMVPNANINAAVMMIGEKGAHLVLQDHRI